ncbi:hypothetical protein PV433_30975 [Paenibacillus sp. GYB004]|uniref:hypothetical protein n=1 Tax=Paenibacillus sp. GYB004 TaxID=2994393 RepID=UPI002F96656D
MADFLCAKCGNVWKGKGPPKDGVICDNCKAETVKPAQALENFSEQELYAAQMEHWFHEHYMMGQQIRRAIAFHEEMAESNREQLELHCKRLELATDEYNAWAKENGLPEVKKGPPVLSLGKAF